MKMNFKSRKCEENGKKVLRYSIRKHHLGVASVVVASVLFFVTGVATVQADGPGAGEPASTSTPGSTSTTSTPGTSGDNTGDTEIANTDTGGNADTSTENNGSDRAASTENGTIKTEENTEASNNNEKPRGLDRATVSANYAGKVSLIGQWTGESHEKKDTENAYKNATDKLGSPLSNPGLFRGAAKTFLGWSDKPPVDGKIAEGARLFSPEDT